MIFKIYLHIFNNNNISIKTYVSLALIKYTHLNHGTINKLLNETLVKAACNIFLTQNSTIMLRPIKETFLKHPVEIFTKIDGALKHTKLN